MMMKFDPLYTMALITGLMGSGHCVGMCGGIVAAFSLSFAKQQRNIFFLLLYNLGRILTYSFIGGVVGWLGSVLAYTNLFHGLMRGALIGSDIFIIIVGLGTAGLWKHLTLMELEFPGPAQVISRAAASLSRFSVTLISLPLGMLMGFLPCGFAYAMFITAAQTASPVKSTLVMLFFGLGTVPALFTFGSAAHWLSTKARTRMLCTAGIMVALMGVYNLGKHISLLGWTFTGPLQFLCH